jgi:hypothetical protein
MYVCMYELCMTYVYFLFGQDHVRWSAVTAFEILSKNKEPFIKLVGAFEAG